MSEFRRIVLFCLGFLIGGIIVLSARDVKAQATGTEYQWCVAGATPTNNPWVVYCGAAVESLAQVDCTNAFSGTRPVVGNMNAGQFSASYVCKRQDGTDAVGRNGTRWRKCKYGAQAGVWQQFLATSGVCPPDPEDEGGDDEDEPDPCKDKAGKPATPTGYFGMGTDPSGPGVPVATCKDSCEAIFSGSCPEAVRLVGGVATYYCKGGYDYSGAACSVGTPTPSPSTPPNDSCPPGQELKSNSSGNKSCVPTEEEPPEDPKPPQCTAPNTPPGCTGTPPPGGGGGGGGGGGDDPEEPDPPEEGDGPGKTFCEQNPTAPGCNKGSFSGFCQQGAGTFTCSGDAVACATAEAVKQLECKFQNSATFDQLRASIGPAYNPTNYMQNMTKTMDISNLIDMSNKDAGSCPSVPAIEVMGESFDVPIEYLCDYAPLVRYIIIFAATIIALRIFFG